MVAELNKGIRICSQFLAVVTTFTHLSIAVSQNASTPPTTISVLSASNRSPSPNSFNTPTINENELKFKIASCHSSLGESRAALAELEGIPSKSRNLEMNLVMAKLY